MLGRLRPAALQVIARTSVMRYKETDKTIAQIGTELNADFILEGSAQREASRQWPVGRRATLERQPCPVR